MATHMDIDTSEQSMFSQFRTVTEYVSAHDVCQIAQTCRSLRWLSKDNEYGVAVADYLFHSKYVDIYGDIDEVKRCLNEAGLSFSVEDESETHVDWWQRYTERYQVARDVDHDETADEQRAQDTIDRVREQLLQFQSNGNTDILQQSAETLLDLLDLFPQSAECYHLLAFICFVLNAFTPALAIISMSRAMIDDDYSPIDELETEIIELLEKVQGDDAPLLSGHELSPQLKHVLTCIFEQFDKDNDQHWSCNELNAFITASNGQSAPLPFLRQFISNYGEDAGRLTFNGLCAFFLQQTLDDPEETRKDLAKHGWDGHTLQPLVKE
ncbi:hypothetical protein BDF22DRAFT_703047 [Syncephalis plumigaleata]|nr:hypothetical protein BDF22DRAFT_703047 [Syncephalis plumigaleata]